MPDNPVGKTQAEITFSLLEYTAVFKKPIIEAWASLNAITAAVLNALEPAGFGIDGVEAKTHSDKPSETTIVFRRTTPAFPALNLTLGLSKVSVAAENLEWTEVDRFIGQISPALQAILGLSKAEVRSQHVGTGLHVQIKTGPRKDVTRPLLNPAALTILDGEVTFPGIVLQYEKSSIFIDASVTHANSLFVRILREHPPEATFPELAKALYKDEERLCSVLGLEGIL